MWSHELYIVKAEICKHLEGSATAGYRISPDGWTLRLCSASNLILQKVFCTVGEHECSSCEGRHVILGKYLAALRSCRQGLHLIAYKYTTTSVQNLLTQTLLNLEGVVPDYEKLSSLELFQS